MHHLTPLRLSSPQRVKFGEDAEFYTGSFGPVPYFSRQGGSLRLSTLFFLFLANQKAQVRKELARGWGGWGAQEGEIGVIEG